jgi:hypothetical protein
MRRSTQALPPAFFSIASPVDADQELLAQWETHLLPLQQAGRITFWSERHLKVGGNLDQERLTYFNQADVIILLISPDFFDTPSCFTLMEQALERRKNNEITVIPLLLRSAFWQTLPLGILDPLPANGIPVTQWTNLDEALHTCGQEVCSLLELPLPVRSEARTRPFFWTTRFRRLSVFLTVFGLIALVLSALFAQIGTSFLSTVTSDYSGLTSIVILFVVLGLLLLIILAIDPIKRILKRHSLF